jgi:hypothetical protein
MGVVATLALCVLFSFRSSAAQRAVSLNVLTSSGAPTVVGHDRSLGKSIVTWAPLRDAERAAFESTGTHGPAKIPAGTTAPPGWSSFWNAAEFAAAAASTGTPYAHVRLDIAVGWPFRAFVCTTGPADTGRVRHGVPLAFMGADRGVGHLLAEPRALPLRPVWAGLAGNVAFYSLASYALLICATVRARRVARLPLRPPTPARRRVTACALLGVTTAACTAILFPLTVRERSVTSASTTRPGAYLTRDIFWTRRSARLSPDELATLTPATARDFDRVLAALAYSNDPARHARQARPQAVDTPDLLGPALPAPGPTMFTSTTTGWPFTCLWGASWQTGEEPAGRVALADVPALAGVAGIINRGVAPIPTRFLWLGWGANSAVFSLAWWSSCALVRRSRAGAPARAARTLPGAAPARLAA